MYGFVGSYKMLINGVNIAVTVAVISTSIVNSGIFIICHITVSVRSAIKTKQNKFGLVF